MGVVEWGALATALTVAGIIGKWVWGLSTRIAQTDAKASAAATQAAGASGKAASLERELSAHKEHVAAEYVSRSALKEVTDAINRLGDRLDNLFAQLLTRGQ